MSSDDDGPSERTAREATAWFVAMNDQNANSRDQAAFRAWLDADPANVAAFAAAQALWDDLKMPAVRLGAGGWYRPDGTQRSRRRWRRAAARLALAAAVAALGVALWRHAPPGAHAAPPIEQRAGVPRGTPDTFPTKSLRDRTWPSVHTAGEPHGAAGFACDGVLK